MIPAHERCEDKYQELLAAKRKRRKPREEEAEFVDIPPHVNRERIAKLQRAEAVAEARPQPDDTPERVRAIARIEKYYRKYFNKMVKAYTRRLGNRALAEDAIHYGFVKAIEQWDEPEMFKAWMKHVMSVTVKKTAAVEFGIMNKSDSKDEQGFVEPPELHDLRSAEAQVDAKMKLDQVKEWIEEERDPLHRAVLDDHFFGQLTLDEAAVKHGFANKRSTHSIVHRFRTKHGLGAIWND